jgi:hypothetical protein
MAKFNRKLHVFRSPKLVTVVDEAVEFFMQTPIQILPPPKRFLGSGVYALYYRGDFEYYTKLSKLNKASYELPIYVGKAVPPGWRTARANVSESAALYNRLREHMKSISQTRNLKVDDFKCQFMILSEIASDLVVPVEAKLIRKYKPLWNMVIDGFGNHDPGKGRYNQAKSDWDLIHPGRIWVNRLTGETASLESIIDKIKQSMDSLAFS